MSKALSLIKNNKINLLTYLLLIIIFFLSRIIYHHLGVRFDLKLLFSGWQLIGIDLLKNHLLQSLLYLHAQPPLFNLGTGIVLHFFPENYPFVFSGLFLFFGLILTLSLYALMYRLNTPPLYAFILTVLFIASPSCILFENWFFYDYPIVVIITLSALFLHRFLSQNGWINGTTFFLLLSSIVLTRSLFHLFWFFLIFSGLLVLKWENRKKIFLCGLFPFLLIMLWIMKNQFLFGTPSTSSWIGMSLAKSYLPHISWEEKKRLIDEGKISNLSLISPYSSLDVVYQYMEKSPKTGVPVLDDELWIEKGYKKDNYNNLSYLKLSQQQMRDTMHVLLNDPSIFFLEQIHAWHSYTLPSSTYLFFKKNQSHISTLDYLYNSIIFWQFPGSFIIGPEGHKHYRSGFFFLISFIVVLFYFFHLLRKLLSERKISAHDLTVLFMLGNIIYVACIGNLIEVGENQRFRFLTDPLLIAFIGSLIPKERINYPTTFLGLKINKKRRF